MVDDAGVAERVWNRTDRIMSNVPMEVRAELEARRALLPVTQSSRVVDAGQGVDAVAGRTVSVS